MREIEVVAAIIASEGKVFATQRGYGHFKGKWEFPGGKVEPGESLEDALVREIHEELNTQISPEYLLDTIVYEYPDFHMTMHCFMCRVVSGNLELLEHSDARWVDAQSIAELDWLPSDEGLLQKLVEQKII